MADRMLQKVLSALFPIMVLALLFSEIASTPFYSPGELAEARQISVDMATEGDFEGAIARFEALVEIASDDQKVWADYIVVLLRAGERGRAWALADKELDFENVPPFVIDELLHSALEAGDNKRAILYAKVGYTRSSDPIEYTLFRIQIIRRSWRHAEASIATVTRGSRSLFGPNCVANASNT